MDKLKFLWEKIGAFESMFEDDERGDFNLFMQRFITFENGELKPTGLFWEVDDVGIFSLQNILPARMAIVSFNFWDQIFNGRGQLCIAMMKFWFEQYKFHKLYTTVPVAFVKTMRATEKLGFTHEGRHRMEYQYKGKWFDVNEYSILSTEIAGIENKTGLKNRKSICPRCGDKYVPGR